MRDDCGNKLYCASADPKPPLTLVEFQMQPSGHDRYAISIKRGFNILARAYTKLFEDRVGNMHNYPLRGVIFPGNPNLVKQDGVWVGEDYLEFQSFVKAFNATECVVELDYPADFPDAVKNIVANKSDICINAMYDVSFLKEVDRVFFNTFENMVLIVPKSKVIPQISYLWMTMQPFTYVAVLSTLLMVCFTTKLVNPRLSLSTSFIFAYSALFRISIKLEGNRKFKMLYLCWYVTIMFVCSMFEAKLFQALVTTRSLPDIDTLDDFLKTNLTVFTARAYVSMASEKMQQANFEFIDKPKLIQMIKTGHDEGAYLVRNSLATSLSTRVVDRDDYPLFHTVEEPVACGHLVYLVQHRSPLQEPLRKIVLLVKAYVERMIIICIYPKDME
ncbi:uncharacterized protein LOC126264642 [Aethina tumida]|uniref:uncharacterized protein LOC126264642 n=1 Tax=Aethina tumida TaxID=116153 RepID=UPI002147A249|nr:uncharacterized protein LOC126264642 [Aethina tumida]